MAPPARREPDRRVSLTNTVLFGPDGMPLRLDPSAGAYGWAGRPVAPSDPPGAEPDAWDVPPGTNLSLAPRTQAGLALTPFSQLRALSEFDLVRVAMEDVKGQVVGMEWQVRVRQEFVDRKARRGDPGPFAPEVDQARRILDSPDPARGWDWEAALTAWLEETLVTDALTVYPAVSYTEDHLGLRQVDGATIKPLVDDWGMPPAPPDPAYYQIRQGRVKRTFTTAELWYLPKNRRANSPYGRSPVEQVLMTVNLALRQAAHELAYYTSGNEVESLFILPANWTKDKIADAQTYWDRITKGKLAQRSGNMRFVPQGTYQPTKERAWQYEFLEFLARVIAWSFGVSPMPIAKLMNRATAEQFESSSMESGVRPVCRFLSRMLNRYLRHRGLEHVEFLWGSDETEDPTMAYQRDVAYMSLPVQAKAVDEVRTEAGLAPVGLSEPLVTTPDGPVPLSLYLADMQERRAQRAELRAKLLAQLSGAPTPGAPESDDEGDDPPPAGGDPEAEDQGDEGDDPEAEPEDAQAAKLAKAAAGPDDGSAAAWYEAAGLHLTKAEAEEMTAAWGGPAAVAELGAWRRQAMRRADLGKAARPFVCRALHPMVAAKVAAALGARPGTDQVRKAFLGTQADPTGTTECQDALADLWAAWLQVAQAKATRWAVAQLKAAAAMAAPPAPTMALAADAGVLAKAAELPAEVLDATALFSRLVSALNLATSGGQADAGAVLGLDFTTPSSSALLFAHQRAAELVGMQWVGGVRNGELVPNPNPKWMISDTLRTTTNNLTSQAITGGWSPQQLTDALDASFGWPWRSLTIARTETAFAYNEGAIQVYESAGVEYVELRDGHGCLPQGHDDEAPPAEPGAVGALQSSRQADRQVWTRDMARAYPVGHPNCVRAFLPYTGGAVAPPNLP